ncbi:response regulator [Pseudomonas sp. dw_358]|uniref:response regulator n=1 Tax=Pseudomonas sp. dw_358 TaxID=2720083 RepID=UPI001BD3B5B3|nr:response regulator [Pseudomonas sp. dw_358]
MNSDHGNRRQRPLRILIVDEVAIQRSVLARRLDCLGGETVAVGSGAAALRAWADASFELLITDCRMPLMDGYALSALLRQLEARQQRAPMTVLGCSACWTPADEALAAQAGMNRLLRKPLAPQVLEAITEPSLDRNRLRQFSRGDARLLRRLEEELVADLRREWRCLQSLAEEDQTALSGSCHRLKGIASLVDAMPLARACAQPGMDQVPRMRLAIEQLLLELARHHVGNALQFFRKFPIPAP